MNKKAFTLIELILVILLLSILALISVPVVSGIIQDSKKKTYNQQLSELTMAAKTYMAKYPSNLPEQDEYGSSCISITDLQKAGVLEAKDILNPNYSDECSNDETCANKYFDGVIMVKWDSDNNKYVYTYDGSKNVCPY
jgi:prepilin-type N-terminal cleavage/methylation domain-containing protein